MVKQEVVNRIRKVYSDGDTSIILMGLMHIFDALEVVLDIMEAESWGNYYTDLYSWSELADAIVNDEGLWADKNTDDDVIYQFCIGVHTEQAYRDFLEGYCHWVMAPNGLAMLLDYPRPEEKEIREKLIAALEGYISLLETFEGDDHGRDILELKKLYNRAI